MKRLLLPIVVLLLGASASAQLPTNTDQVNAWLIGCKCVKPLIPALISPPNATTGVGTSATLTYQALGATTVDVYLNSVKVVNNLAVFSYTANNLTPSTAYKWYVVSRNGAGTNTSATWSFTTAASTPPPVTPPSADGATNPPTSPLIDSGRVPWTIGTLNASGFGAVVRNGTTVAGTLTDREVACLGVVYHHGTDGNWYKWNATTSWFDSAGTTQPCLSSPQLVTPSSGIAFTPVADMAGTTCPTTSFEVDIESTLAGSPVLTQSVPKPVSGDVLVKPFPPFATIPSGYYTLTAYAVGSCGNKSTAGTPVVSVMK